MNILMRLGIGPAEHLRSHGIPVQIDLPGVGANLADHAGADIECGYRGPARTSLSSTCSPPSTARPPQRPSAGSDAVRPARRPAGLRDRRRPAAAPLTGTVRLRSADPAAPPRIELPGLRGPSGTERLAEANLRALEVARRPEIRRPCAEPPAPQPRTAAELPDLIRTNGYSFPHVAGTCAMGPRADDGMHLPVYRLRADDLATAVKRDGQGSNS